MPATQKPAKPVKAGAKRPPVEDYSTPYKPHPQNTATAAPAAVRTVPGLAKIVIEKDVPLPDKWDKQGKMALMHALLGRLQPTESAKLPTSTKYALGKAIQHAHKAGAARFSLRVKHDDANTLRVWRVQ